MSVSVVEVGDMRMVMDNMVVVMSMPVPSLDGNLVGMEMVDVVVAMLVIVFRLVVVVLVLVVAAEDEADAGGSNR